MRHSTSESYECRLIILNFIVVSMKLLRDLNSENLDEYMLIQYASVI